MSFAEGLGGEIIGPDGQTVVRVCVENLRTEEARRVVSAVLAALRAEFKQEEAAQ